MAAGDAAVVVALADSVLFSLEPDAARSRVLLFLGISMVPFLFVAPLIGPAIDRMRGGRRLVVAAVALARVVLALAMVGRTDSLLLFPLAFTTMVLQKAYAISKSALVPSVVMSDDDLVEANSKLGLISGLVGAVAVLPAGLLQKTIGPTATFTYAAVLFLVAFVAALRLPREVVAAQPADALERDELQADSVVLAAAAMLFVRASVGFTFFHLFFWFRRQDAGLVWFGASVAMASLGTMTANVLSPRLRRKMREETMLFSALLLVALAGLLAGWIGGIVGALALAGSVNVAAAAGRLAFEAIVQRDAPDANRGRVFARFETRFQLAWVAAGVVPVLFAMPGRYGFAFVGVTGLAALLLYGSGNRAARGRTRRRSGSDRKPRRVRRPTPRPAPRSGR